MQCSEVAALIKVEDRRELDPGLVLELESRIWLKDHGITLLDKKVIDGYGCIENNHLRREYIKYVQQWIFEAPENQSVSPLSFDEWKKQVSEVAD